MAFRIDVLKETVSWAEKLEDYGVKATVRLDDKAQQTGGLAGLFLAAAFGFVKPDSVAALSPGMRVVAGGMLLAIITVLVLCLAACLSVTWLRNTPMPIGLSTLEGLNEDLRALDESALTERVQENFYSDRLKFWEVILESRRLLNRDKARRLMIAQSLLALGMLLVSALLFSVISSMLHSRHAH